jgi:glycine dehydrogenase subunit 2
MGLIRPGDMGFDCVHLNLHKTFSTPHGGGGPGAGAVGCKAFLAPYLPKPVIAEQDGGLVFDDGKPESVGRLKAFYGNFLTVVKALTYILTLGGDGLTDTAKNAVLNANYFMKRLGECYEVAYKGICMHEFVLTMEKEAKDRQVTAMDIAKALLDNGIHPPTVYFPLIVREALMVEPTETEGKETLDKVADVFLRVYREAMENPEAARQAPVNAPIRRPDELKAARELVLRYNY